MDAVQVPEGFTAFAALLKATKKSTEEEAQEEWTALSRKVRCAALAHRSTRTETQGSLP